MSDTTDITLESSRLIAQSDAGSQLLQSHPQSLTLSAILAACHLSHELEQPASIARRFIEVERAACEHAYDVACGTSRRTSAREQAIVSAVHDTVASFVARHVTDTILSAFTCAFKHNQARDKASATLAKRLRKSSDAVTDHVAKSLVSDR